MTEGDVWQRFTGPATRVVQYAQEWARKLGGNTVGTEHLLLGLLRESDGVAARVLERLGVSLGRVRSEIRRQLGFIDNRISTEGPISWSPDARRALELAQKEASELNPRLGLPNYIDTEHILLGLIGERKGKAARILSTIGIDARRVRREVETMLGGTESKPEQPSCAPAPRAMPVYEITVETEFSAAHSLEGYEGACARLHGHNYRVLIHVAGNQLDQHGMLLDFREIRRICESFVSELDHQHLNKLESFASMSPTSENLARHIFHHVAGAIADLPGLGGRKVWPVKVTVYESAKSAASYGEPCEQ